MNVLLILVLFSAILNWFAIAREDQRLERITKPLVILLLIAWVIGRGELFTDNNIDRQNLWWFVGALFFGLLGDMFLAPPNERFLQGLAAFLLGHFAYIIGMRFWPLESYALSPALLLALIVLVPAVTGGRRILQAVNDRGEKALRIPVLLYITALSGVVFCAIYSAFINRIWSIPSGYLVAGGALLFYTSDLLLAWNRFVETLPNAKLKIVSSYHLAQIMIAVGATIQHLNY